jgi:hypothetical protein
MAEKKYVYKAEVLALPPLKMVLSEIPAPDPDGRKGQKPHQPSPEMEITVKRLIAHLKENEK